MDDVHDTLAQVYTSDDLQEAYMTGAEREPTGLEVEAAAEQLYYSDGNSSGLLLDSDWNRLPDGNKAIYRNRVRTNHHNNPEKRNSRMNENTNLTDIISAALAAGCQISVTITPKDFYNESQEPEDERERKHRLAAFHAGRA